MHRIVLVSAMVLAGSALMMAGSMVSCTRSSQDGTVPTRPLEAPRSGCKWVVPVPDLEPRTGENKTVFIDSRNQTYVQDFDLRDILEHAAQAAGWTVVSSPDKANIRLRARTRFFDEVDAESGGAGRATALGWIACAAAGGATHDALRDALEAAAENERSRDQLATKMPFFPSPAVFDAPREWTLITDFLIEEYHPGESSSKCSRRPSPRTAETRGRRERLSSR